jgi:flagellar hook-associated protein 1 FlgK
VQTLLGRPDDGSSVASQITNVMSAFGAVAIDPASIVRRNGALSSIEQMTDSFDHLALKLQEVRGDADKQVTGLIGKVNGLIARIHELNPLIQKEMLAGNNASGLMDQRQQAIDELAGYLDVRVQEQPNGRVFVSTTSGIALVSDIRVQLEYAQPSVVTSATVFPEIIAQRINPNSGTEIGPPLAFDRHVTGGELAGLINMRNNTIEKLAEELGALAGALADQLNAVHNDNSAVPPPNSLTGVNTGLLATDALNFTGATTLAVVADDGTLVRRIDIDFDAGTYSVDGGGAAGFGGTIGGLVTGLNAALAGVGSASFTNGQLTVGATAAANGVAFMQDSADPSGRGGRGFSHFFGLNDLVQARVPTHYQTGLSATDPHGFTAGQTVEFAFRGPGGDIALEATLTIGGSTVGDIINDLNAAFTGFATFSLGADGEIAMTPSAAYSGYRLESGSDNTSRGTTGVSLTRLFGLGLQYTVDQAAEMRLSDALDGSPEMLALGKLDFSAGSAVGDVVLGTGDNRGALALQNVESAAYSFGAAGYFSAIDATIGEYAARFLADAGERANISENASNDLQALGAEVSERKASIEGVNLDEELSNMMIYQQSYNAGARIFTVTQELIDSLLSIVR